MRFFEIAAGLLTTALVGFAFAAPRATGQVPDGTHVKEFTVLARRFEFVPDRIEVNQGDHVRITVRSADGTHGFDIKKLGVKQEIRRGGEPVTVEFDANRAGTFEIACSEYCGKGHSHMKATLLVNTVNEGARE